VTQSICACTAIASNYFAFARVLADSFHRFHPSVPLYILVADSPAHGAAPTGEHDRFVTLEELQMPRMERMLIRYDRKQVLTAVKPALLRHVLDCGYETAIYLDADMLVTANLDPVLNAVAGHAMTLTPHVGPAFAAAERLDLERALLFAGMYNAGFVGVTECDEARRFLDWWDRRLQTHCVDDIRAGLHFDQRWLDMAPALVGDLLLMRDPGVNVAYWNLPDLNVSSGPDGLLVNGTPLRLFHFSGFDPSQSQRVTRYVPSLRVEELGPVAGLFHQYAALLQAAGWNETRTRPWPWDGWLRLLRFVARRRTPFIRNPIDWLLSGHD
jgi:hypothetical protein